MYVFSVCALCVCLRESVLSSHGLHSGDPTCVFKLGSKRLYPRTVSPSYLGALLSPRFIAYPREWGMSEHPFPKICGRNRIPGPCPTPARLTQSFTVRMGGTESQHVASRLQKCLGSTCSREPPSLRRKEESCCEAVQFIDNSKLPSLTLGGGGGGGDKRVETPSRVARVTHACFFGGGLHSGRRRPCLHLVASGLVSWATYWLGEWVLGCQSVRSVSDCRLPRGRQSEPLTAFHSHIYTSTEPGPHSKFLGRLWVLQSGHLPWSWLPGGGGQQHVSASLRGWGLEICLEFGRQGMSS